ncbi:MAG TPA: hypothetical protein VFM58_16715 [Solirubrobacteraceae bacterium]|nr:hypothetical protein [Solirubrobacteraceae bacterium]
MAADVEIERALNTLSATLNDQGLDRVDVDRLDEIVVASLGGAGRLHVFPDAERPQRLAWLRDSSDATVGRVKLAEDGHWTVSRC